jgi:hypothetical protein
MSKQTHMLECLLPSLQKADMSPVRGTSAETKCVASGRSSDVNGDRRRRRGEIVLRHRSLAEYHFNTRQGFMVAWSKAPTGDAAFRAMRLTSFDAVTPTASHDQTALGGSGNRPV